MSERSSTIPRSSNQISKVDNTNTSLIGLESGLD